jgi:translation initiation factor 2 alpha subunit (eIF-2alpha)
MDFEEGDNVLCTVKRISGTTVFVHIEDDPKHREATIVTSEIAPGRIRNLREYVVPGKKIVCKILSIDKSGNIHLSLRRVSDKEKREVLDREKKEKSSWSIIKSVGKEKSEEIVKKIKEKEKSLYDFLQKCKTEPKQLEKFFTSEETEKICKILEQAKPQRVEVKKQFSLTSKKSDGITTIKNILKPYADVSYLAAGRFVITLKSENYKKANHEIQKILKEIEGKAEKQGAKFQVKEK